MRLSWKYAACGLLLAAYSEKHPAAGNQVAASRPPAAASTSGDQATAAPAAGLPERLQPVAVAAAEVPAAQRLPGKLLEAWRWPDANGDNLLVVYRTVSLSRNERRAQTDPTFRNKLADPATVLAMEDEARGAQLLVRQYVRRPGAAYTELWRLQDGVSDCPFDLLLGMAPHATTVTDLDHDGQSETTLVYALDCRSDVSPDELKLILHEGAAKYALRGRTVVQLDSVPARQRQPATPCCLGQLSAAQQEKLYDGPAEAYMGRYFSEADFQGQPAFLRFARQQWQQHSVFDAAQAQVE